MTSSRINFKLCTHIYNRLPHKTVPAFFLIMSHSFFIAIMRRVLKAYFAWKQVKVDYSKNIWKEENRGHSFVSLLVGYISVKKIIEKLNSDGVGAHKVPKVVSFCTNFWLWFYRSYERVKKVSYIYWKSLVLVHLKRYYKKMYIIALSSFLTHFYFAWKGTLRL